MKQYIVSLLAMIFCLQVASQEVNYDEKKVQKYKLPSLLVCENGRKVKTATEWEKTRRHEIMSMFSEQMYGKTPRQKFQTTYETISENDNDLDGKAYSKQVNITLHSGSATHILQLLVYYPKNVRGKIPMFVTYNFNGNHSISPDPYIIFSESVKKVTDTNKPPVARGANSDRFPLKMIITEGYGFVTLCYHDVYPDAADMRESSVLKMFGGYERNKNNPAYWNAIGAWAWGTSRVMDFLETEKCVDIKKVVIMGHSRQGKAALWCGAQDQRFAIVISNNSGCGGAALSKRVFGENIKVITNTFPHWFCKNFNQYAGGEDKLPFDQHELIALIAPRPVYVASAQDDAWADPKGEFLAAAYAGEVYKLYGLDGLNISVMPPLHTPIMNQIGYHIRAGKHGVTEYDWKNYIQFANKHFYGSK
ncbi:MAG: acetylxylan esterase [Rikenellaceae bacterium]